MALKQQEPATCNELQTGFLGHTSRGLVYIKYIKIHQFIFIYSHYAIHVKKKGYQVERLVSGVTRVAHKSEITSITMYSVTLQDYRCIGRHSRLIESSLSHHLDTQKRTIANHCSATASFRPDAFV